MTIERMEEIFWEVGEENGQNTWYKIFDSGLFEIVCERIAHEMGIDSKGNHWSWFEVVDEVNDEFSEWACEMGENL